MNRMNYFGIEYIVCTRQNLKIGNYSSGMERRKKSNKVSLDLLTIIKIIVPRQEMYSTTAYVHGVGMR